ncbi:hypothetical protein [Streptomyces virginiae]|uniref:hypothetical protein n=1 Tax=Streptomyces virginiae TaxID=1961 RepID=UPI003415F0E4
MASFPWTPQPVVHEVTSPADAPPPGDAPMRVADAASTALHERHVRRSTSRRH